MLVEKRSDPESVGIPRADRAVIKLKLGSALVATGLDTRFGGAGGHRPERPPSPKPRFDSFHKLPSLQTQAVPVHFTASGSVYRKAQDGASSIQSIIKYTITISDRKEENRKGTHPRCERKLTIQEYIAEQRDPKKGEVN